MLPYLVGRRPVGHICPVTTDIKTIEGHLGKAQYAAAADACRQVLEARPDDPDALHFLGVANWHLGADADSCAALIGRAISKSPDRAAMHHNLATVLAGSGRIEQAEQCYRTAIAINPRYAEAYYNLAGIRKFQAGEPDIADMKRLYATPGISAGDRDFICHALAKALDDAGIHDEAFQFASEGNRVRKPAFDPDQFEADIALLTTLTDAGLLKPRQGRGHPSKAPIFIVGMPRSGTTLVEQILSQHPDVYGAGELPSIGSFHAAMRETAVRQWGYTGRDYGFWALIPDEAYGQAGAAVLNIIAMRARCNPKRFTDKMPSNVFFLGLIAMMFPNARIVHVRRHPLDTCVSCFFQRFSIGHDHTCRLDWLGRYYRGYVSAMDHWQQVLPLPILEIRYEDLVTATEDHARRLVAFCGLDWHAACADPSGNVREIRTASRWQVRQPVYRTSVQRWRRYEDHLAPLIEALGGMDWIAAQHDSRRSGTS